MPSIVVTGRGLSNFQVKVTGLDTSYSRTDRYIDWYVGGSLHSTQSGIGAYVSETTSFTLSGLGTNTNYNVYGIFYYTNGGTYYNVILNSINIPTGFLWNYPKTSGGAFILYASEWNGFTSNINYVRSYKGLYTVSFTIATTGNPFTASMYNQAQPAINGLYSYMTSDGKSYISSTSTVSSGDVITGNSLEYLRLALNSVL